MTAIVEPLIKYIPDYRVLICTHCKVAVPRNDLDSHLRSSHKGVKKAMREELLDRFEDVVVAQTTADLQPLPDDSKPLSFLIAPQRGVICAHCPIFRSLHKAEIRKHSLEVHGKRVSSQEISTLTCYVQSWIKRYVTQKQRYWIVKQDDAPLSCCAILQQPKEEKHIGLDAKLANMEADEEKRIHNLKDREIALYDDLETDENTEWLRASGWARWFQHKPLPLLVAAATVPSPGCAKDLFLGSWHGVECSSPAKTEKTLQLVAIALQAVVDRCISTLEHTPRVLRCWVRSWGPSYSPYPFECPQPPTVRRYSRIWISAVCYFFRMWDLGIRLKESTVDLCGLEFTAEQRHAMQDVWSHFHEIASNTDDCALALIPLSCLEKLAQLFVLIWTQSPQDSNLERTAIANFTGILGIHPVEYAFRRAYDYTPYLSALIWIGRLIMLEYALPPRAYNSLPKPWLAREDYPDFSERLRFNIKPRYMERGSIAPMGYLIERRQHGRAIAKREGPRTNIAWSLDGQTLHIDRAHINVVQLRSLIHGVVARAQHQLDDLFFEWWPEINLDLKDDMSNRRPGYSFLSDPDNHLQSKFRLLSQRAFSPDYGKMSWATSGQERIMQYLRNCDRLVQLLFAAIHMTSGMPARGEELRTIRWANTATIARNVVCFQGRFILIFPYNKACTNTNNAFYVVRSPSPAVERMLFVFLVYVRPFRDMISRNYRLQQSDLEQNRHVFGKHDWEANCFSSGDCLQSLQTASLHSPFVLTMRNYRQIAIAMSKKHIPALLTPFDAHAPNDLNGFLHLLAFQTGHNPSTRAGAYALETAFPSKLQPDLIYRYLDNSDVWQKFLLLGKNDYIELHTHLTTPQNINDSAYHIVKEESNVTQDSSSTPRSKRSVEEPLTPTSKRIRLPQEELQFLVDSKKERLHVWELR